MSRCLDVLLYGPGSIGAFYAFVLHRSPRVRLFVVARSGYEAIKLNGITVKSDSHGEHVFRPVQVFRRPSDAKRVFDYVVCTNKAIESERVARDLAPVVEVGRTTFALMQNGIGIEEPFRKAYPTCPILSGVVWVGGAQLSPGVVHHYPPENTEIGLFESQDINPTVQQESLDQFVSCFREGGTPVQVLPNIQTARWKKTIWNMAWNSITTLTSWDTASWLSSSPFAVPLTRTLMAEGISVAKALRVPEVDYALVDEYLQKINQLGPIYSSMYYDSKFGRPMEVEAIFGTAVRKGRELGVSTPTLGLVYGLLLAIDARMASDRNKRDEA